MSSFTAIKNLQRDLKLKGRDLRKFKKGFVKNYRARLKCDRKLRECEFVLKELDSLKEDAIVYKLVGPILVKQDGEEPNANVRKIFCEVAAELKRVDAIIEDLEEKQINKREKISKVEQRLRSLKLREETKAWHSMSSFSEFFVPKYIHTCHL